MAKIVFIPGNSGSTTHDNWFPGVKTELEATGLKIVQAEFPDPQLGRESIWLPFLLNELKVDENTILIGHSTGAIASMRLAETHKIFGSVLVGAYYSDLGIEAEKLSGYFDKPWNWSNIVSNQKWISLFASEDDEFIPIEEPRYIHSKLNCEYHEYKDQGHFFRDTYCKETMAKEIALALIRNIDRKSVV